MSSDLTAPLFAAGVSDSKRRSDTEAEGVLKVARLAQLRARLSPIRSSASLPSSPAVPRISEVHVEVSSPRLTSLPSVPLFPNHAPIDHSLDSPSQVVPPEASLVEVAV